MRNSLIIPLLAFALNLTAGDSDSVVARKFFNEELLHGKSYEMLDELCNDIGHRLSGSEGAARAVKWGEAIMQEYKFDRVFLQEVMVPHWVRGAQETARIQRANSEIGRAHV